MRRVNPSILGQHLSKLFDVRVDREGEAYPHLARALIDVKDGDEDGAELLLGDRQRDAEERVKCVGLAFTTWAGETRSELGLEDVDDEAVVAAHVIGKALGGQDVVRPSWQVFQPLVFLLGGGVQLLVYSATRQMSSSCQNFLGKSQLTHLSRSQRRNS